MNNETLAVRYMIKLTFIVLLMCAFYIVTSIAEANFAAASWSTTGATVYYIISILFFMTVLTNKK
jgi:hypothetical protein